MLGAGLPGAHGREGQTRGRGPRNGPRRANKHSNWILPPGNMPTHLWPGGERPAATEGMQNGPPGTARLSGGPTEASRIRPRSGTHLTPERARLCVWVYYFCTATKSPWIGVSISFFNPPGMSSARQRHASISSSCSWTNETHRGVYLCRLC